jgi:hypothetical protein
VLFRGGLDKLKHRIRPQPLMTEEDEHEEEHDEDTTRRPVAEVFADQHEHDEDYEVADEAEFVEDDAPRPRYKDEDVDDAEIVDVADEAEFVRRPAAEPRYEDEEFEDDELGELAGRSGRGGFNPTADASARAHRYAVRQRFVLGLLVAVFASVALSLTITPTLWYLTGAITAALGGYLFYLRKQVRLEEQIRARRMARYARSQRHSQRDQHAVEAEERPTAKRGPEERRASERPQPQRPQTTARAPRVVAVDEDDPDFVELSSPQSRQFRRAAGE